MTEEPIRLASEKVRLQIWEKNGEIRMRITTDTIDKFVRCSEDDVTIYNWGIKKYGDEKDEKEN